MSEEAWTVGRLLTWTTDWLGSKGSESPRLDAEVLLAHVLRCQRIMLYAKFEDVVMDETRGRFRDLVRRRAAGEPVAYLVGAREFFSLPFVVSSSVLVPRPETEALVSRVLDLCREAAAPRIVDVGTGSGAIAVVLARHLPRARITASDVSSAAIEVARTNADRHGVGDRVTFVEADLLDDPGLVGPWDVIVGNLPYVRESEFESLPRDVRDHEPRTALVAGPRGVELIERLAAESTTRLVPGGWLVLEAGPLVAGEVSSIFAATEGLEPGAVITDLAGLPRVFQACRSR
jgi:release factor glutamine methyltransferase